MFGGKCKIQSFLAHAMAVYCISSIYYYLKTRSVGTPFNDSLSDSQLLIKEQSAGVRKSIFFEGIMISVGVLLFTRPFEKC